jgi:hypothetical protein
MRCQWWMVGESEIITDPVVANGSARKNEMVRAPRHPYLQVRRLRNYAFSSVGTQEYVTALRILC